MKVFGSLKELVSLVFRQSGKEVNLTVGTQSGSSTDRTFQLPAIDSNATTVLKTLVDTDSTQALTNKSLSDSTSFVVDVTDNTKKLAFDVGGSANTKTTLVTSQTADRTITFPDATGTVVTTGAPSAISVNSSSTAFKITQEGSGNAFVVEDSASPDSTSFVIDNVGRVGIGSVSTPFGYALEVGGTAKVDSLTVHNNSILKGTGDNEADIFNDASTITMGTVTGGSAYNIGTGATTSSNTKTVNLGTGGLAGSTTNINIGSAAGNGTVTINENTTLAKLNSTGVVHTNASGVLSTGTVALGSEVSGTLSPTNGGTGQNFSSASGVIKASAGTFSAGSVSLTADVSGTLGTSNGGTGATSPNAALNNLLPAQGSSANKYLKTDGTNTSWASASGGAGELNAVLNPSGADGITGWAAGTSHNTPTVTSGANNPLDPVVSTAFSFSATAAVALGSQTSTSGVYDAITLPVGLENRKLKVEFYYTTPASADGTWALSIYKGATRLALSTDSSGDTVLPAGTTGKFVAYFDTDDTNSYSVNFVQRTRTNANTLYITNVIVGPGIQPQGAVVAQWQDITIGLTATTPPAATTTGRFRRVGDSMELSVSTVAITNLGSGAWEWTLPSGYTIDQTKINGTTLKRVGEGNFYDSSNGANSRTGPIYVTTNGRIRFYIDGYGNFASGVTGLDINTSDEVGFDCLIPIAEWAGSGTVNLAQNDVEYAYNTDATDAPNTNSFGYGPSGTSLPGVTFTAGRLKRVRFNSPIQPTDVITLEIDVSGQGQWAAANGDIEVSGLTVAASTSTTGIGRITRVSTNEVDVYIGQYRAGTSNWAAGTATGKWRLKKVSGGAAVGFGHASATESGLVNTTTQTFAGNKTFSGSLTASELITASSGILNTGLTGANTSTVIASGSGKVGEFKIDNFSGLAEAQTVSGNTWTAPTAGILELTLGQGVWLIGYSVTIQVASSTASYQSGNVAIFRAGTLLANTLTYAETSSTSGYPVVGSVFTGCVSSITVQAITSGTVTFNLRTRSRYDSSVGYTRILGTSLNTGLTNPDAESNIFAIRIA